MPSDSVKKSAAHPSPHAPARSTSTKAVPMMKRDATNQLCRSVTTAQIEPVQQLRRSLDVARAEVREVRESLRRCQAEMTTEFHRRLNVEQQKWQAGKEKALAANTASLRRVFDEKLTAALRVKDKELTGLRARLRVEVHSAVGPGAACDNARGALQCDRANVPIRQMFSAIDSRRKGRGRSDTVNRREERAARCARPITDTATDDSFSTTGSESTTTMSSYTLPRTPSKQVASPLKTFGGVQVISKDEHDKERQRWASKIEDVEVRLMDAESFNSDMNQVKAELNKKIVELERNQKPLLEQNRKLNDRNRLLQQEMKKIEEKLRHAQDDYLTLKDSYERVLKDNASLKEKRSFPEKLEEYDRYRHQVLEYSKCITALRQTAAEKDRRYDLLALKFRRLRKCLSSNGETDEDKQSSFGGSDTSVSSISLDTITEDLEGSVSKSFETNYQQLVREHHELQRAFATAKMNNVEMVHWRQKEQTLRDQLKAANARISQLENVIQSEMGYHEKESVFTATIEAQREQIIALLARSERLDRELLDSKEQSELLEFQVLELQESSKLELEQSVVVCQTKDSQDQSVGTDDDEAFFSDMSEDDETTNLPIDDLKIRFTLLKHRRELKKEDRAVIRQAKGYFDVLEAQLKEWGARAIKWAEERRALEARHQLELADVTRRMDEKASKQKRKKELQQEIELLNKRINEMQEAHDQSNRDRLTLEKDLDKLRYMLQLKEQTEVKERQRAEELAKKVAEMGDSRRCEIELMERNARQHSDNLIAVRNQLEQLRNAHERLQSDKLQTEAALADAKKQVEDAHAELHKAIDSKGNTTDLERRYAEAKYRLKESLKVVHDYESVINKAKDRNAQLEAKVASMTSADELHSQINRTQAYNEQLEQQFAMQIQMVEALKTQLLKYKPVGELSAQIARLADGDLNAGACTEIARHIDGWFKAESNIDGDLRQFATLLSTVFKRCATTSTNERPNRVFDKRPRPYGSAESGWWSQPSSSEAATSPDDGDQRSDDDSQSDSGVASVASIKPRPRKHRGSRRSQDHKPTVPMERVTELKMHSRAPTVADDF